MDLSVFLQQHPFLAATVVGVTTAMRLDWIAFKKFQTFEQAAEYDWKVAGWRWFHGGVSGLGGALFGDSIIRNVAQLF